MPSVVSPSDLVCEDRSQPIVRMPATNARLKRAFFMMISFWGDGMKIKRKNQLNVFAAVALRKNRYKYLVVYPKQVEMSVFEIGYFSSFRAVFGVAFL